MDLLGCYPKKEENMDKIDEKLILSPGIKIKWYYQADLDFYGHEDNIREISEFHGIIVPAPNVEIRAGYSTELEIDQCIVVVVSTPTEGEYPECEYIALGELLDDDNLIEVYSDDEYIKEVLYDLWRYTKGYFMVGETISDEESLKLNKALDDAKFILEKEKVQKNGL